MAIDATGIVQRSVVFFLHSVNAAGNIPGNITEVAARKKLHAGETMTGNATGVYNAAVRRRAYAGIRAVYRARVAQAAAIHADTEITRPVVMPGYAARIGNTTARRQQNTGGTVDAAGIGQAGGGPEINGHAIGVAGNNTIIGNTNAGDSSAGIKRCGKRPRRGNAAAGGNGEAGRIITRAQRDLGGEACADRPDTHAALFARDSWRSALV